MNTKLYTHIKAEYQKYYSRLGTSPGKALKWIIKNFDSVSLDILRRTVEYNNGKVIIKDEYGNQIFKKFTYKKGGDYDGFRLKITYSNTKTEGKGIVYIKLDSKDEKGNNQSSSLKKEYTIIKGNKNYQVENVKEFEKKLEEEGILDDIGFYSLNQKLKQKNVPGTEELVSEVEKNRKNKKKDIKEFYRLSRGSLYRKRYSRY